MKTAAITAPVRLGLRSLKLKPHKAGTTNVIPKRQTF